MTVTSGGDAGNPLISSETERALAAFGLQEVCSVSRLSGGTANSNELIETRTERYVLRRRSAKYSTSVWVDYEEQYVLHASARQIPVLVPLPAKDGTRRVCIGTDMYQLFPYLSGQAYVPQRLEQLKSAGAFLGRLHRAGEGFAPSVDKQLPRYDDPAVIADALHHAAATVLGMKAEQKKTLERMIEYTVSIRTHVSDEAYRALPLRLIHGDYHPANVAFDEDNVSVLYDLDWISRQPRLRDVADLLLYFAGVRREPLDGGSIYSLIQGCEFDAERIRCALRAYATEAGMPLTPNETEALPDLMMARLLHSRVQALAKVPAERAASVLVDDLMPSLDWLERHRLFFMEWATADCSLRSGATEES